MKFKAAIFDLDGTLLDTIADLADSLNIVLQRHGLEIHDYDAYRHFVGDGVKKLVSRAAGYGDSCDGPLFDILLEENKAEYAVRWDIKTRPYDGVAELLQELANRGLKLGVLSNKPQKYTPLCVEKFLGEFSWDAVQGVDENTPPKPEPKGALAMAEKFGAAPSEVIYFGDTNTDMRTAKNAGFFAVGVAWGFREKAELQDAGADVIIGHPAEALTLL